MFALKTLILRLKVQAVWLQWQAHELERIWHEQFSVPPPAGSKTLADEGNHLTTTTHTAAPI